MTAMINHTPRWSHARGNTVVPSRWQATTTGAPFLLLDVGGVGLVHGIEHIDLPAGCV